VIVSANFGVEPGKLVPYKPLLDGALEMIDFKPLKCIVFNRPGVTRNSFEHKQLSFSLQTTLLFFANSSPFLCKQLSFSLQTALIFFANSSHFLCKQLSFSLQTSLIFFANTQFYHFLCKQLSFSL